MTHLTELPGEVIHLICSLLEDRDLFRLGFASRYLHHVAYPNFLARRGVGARDGDVADLRSDDVRRTIKSSLFPVCLSRIILPVDIGASTARGERYPPPATALELLRKVDRVQEVHVKIGSASSTTPEIDARSTLSHGAPNQLPMSSSMDHEFRGWDRLMGTLLTMAHCRTLLVEVDDQQCDVSSDVVEESILGGYYGVKGAMNRFRLLLGKSLVTPFRWLGIELSSGLQEFCIHSPILFHPALCHWTLSTLRQPNVTSVSLDRLQVIEKETWGLLLPLIVVPNLTKLSINLCSAPTEDLYAFLARHPQLEELSLGPNLAPLNPNATLPKNALCRLRSLTGTAKQLVGLLTSSTPNPPLESTLKTVRVLYRTRRGSKSLANVIDNDLAPICFRLRSMDKVVLSVFIESPATDWVVQPSPGNRTPFIATDPTFEDQQSQAGPSAPQPLWASFDSQLTSTITFTGTCVTHLEFKFNVFVLPAAMVTALPKWLSPFEKIERFDLITASSTLDCHIPLRRPRLRKPTMYGPPWEKPHHEEAFLEGVLKSCPGVTRVCVNGEVIEEIPVVPGRRRIKKLV